MAALVIFLELLFIGGTQFKLLPAEKGSAPPPKLRGAQMAGYIKKRTPTPVLDTQRNKCPAYGFLEKMDSIQTIGIGNPPQIVPTTTELLCEQQIIPLDELTCAGHILSAGSIHRDCNVFAEIQ